VNKEAVWSEVDRLTDTDTRTDRQTDRQTNSVSTYVTSTRARAADGDRHIIRRGDRSSKH